MYWFLLCRDGERDCADYLADSSLELSNDDKFFYCHLYAEHGWTVIMLRQHKRLA